ncbi:MAG TPA: hypothetical protein VE616_08245 [Candidatus Udaeobacter sp.]|jgi:hypothetical protein|nr:hypothetical protein [Candidatus Udaeobacter sp.]
MSDLATLAMDAHGGLAHWRRFKTVSAHLVQGGRQPDGSAAPTRLVVSIDVSEIEFSSGSGTDCARRRHGMNETGTPRGAYDAVPPDASARMMQGDARFRMCSP